MSRLMQVATSAYLLSPEAGQPAPTEEKMSKQGWGQTRIYEVRHHMRLRERLFGNFLQLTSFCYKTRKHLS